MGDWSHQVLNNVTVKYVDYKADRKEKELLARGSALNSWNDVKPEVQHRLEYVINTAPKMVAKALERLNRYRNEVQLMMRGGPPCSDVCDYICDGLAKYFAIENWMEDVYWTRWVNGIIQTFDKMAAGLSSHYVIQLRHTANMQDGAYAGALHVGDDIQGTTASPIREVFGFTTEADVHVPWQGFGGDILFQIPFVVNGEKGVPKNKIDEMMARVLVHEGSHKWGSTKDIMYKHSTFGAKATEFDKEVKKGMSPDSIKRKAEVLFKNAKASEMTRMGPEKFRSSMNVPKPLIGMKGNLVGKTYGARIEDIRWLENADSYAWFARRMWKLSVD